MGLWKKSGWEKGIFKKHLTIYRSLWYDKRQRAGEVSEWFKELVLKTSDLARDQEFESLPLRHRASQHICFIYRFTVEKYPSGEGAPLLRE